MEQFTAMRKAGINKPNPRKQILKDILSLIEEKRLLGFWPIVIMDANGDPNCEKRKDDDFGQFIKDAGLTNYYGEKFPEPISTCLGGTKHPDYILIDPKLVNAIVSIGYLRLHEGTFLDHVVAYVDFNSKKLFKGTINRPVDLRFREFRIKQTDKVEDFINTLIPAFKQNSIKERVFRLATLFMTEGRTNRNIQKYQKLDQQIKETVLAIAKKVGKKKYVYMRSPEMTLCGRYLTLTKKILNCRDRNAPFIVAAMKQAAKLEFDLGPYWTISVPNIRKEVYERRKELWQAQKTCKSARMEWLQGVEKDRAKAEGNKERETNLEDMLRVAKSRAANRKLGAITKGKTRPLDRVQIPNHDWFLSKKSQEIFHHVDGNFEAYPRSEGTAYFTHHTLKVLLADAIKILVEEKEGFYNITKELRWYYSFSRDMLFQKIRGRIEVYRHCRDGFFGRANHAQCRRMQKRPW